MITSNAWFRKTELHVRQKVADDVGLVRSYFSEIVRGKRTATIHTAMAIVEAAEKHKSGRINPMSMLSKDDKALIRKLTEMTK